MKQREKVIEILFKRTYNISINTIGKEKFNGWN